MANITILKSITGNLNNLNSLNRGYDLDNRYVAIKDGKVYLVKEELEKHYSVSEMQPFTNRDGYLEYVLTNKDGNKKHIMGQIAICGTFQDNPLKLPHVNHKDGVRDNIKNNNLEWSTISDNLSHSYKVLGRKPSNKK